jgi:hypothetical protein
MISPVDEIDFYGFSLGTTDFLIDQTTIKIQKSSRNSGEKNHGV